MRRIRFPSRAKTTAAWIAAVAVLALAGLWVVFARGTADPAGVGLLALITVRSAAALQSRRTADRLGAAASARAWRFLAAACGLAAIGALLAWGAWALRGRTPSVPSLPDLLLLAAAASALWAVAGYGAGPGERFGRLRNWLDVAIAFVAILGLCWLTLLQPVLEIGIAAPVQAFWAVLWPSLDFVFLALVLRVLLTARPGHERRSLGVLGLAGVAALAGNLFAGLGAITGNAPPAWRVDSMWILAGILGALAGFEAGRARAGPALAAGTGRGGRAYQVEALLPIALTYAVVGYVGVDAWIKGSVDPFGLGVAIALTLLLFARQGVVAGQSEMRQYAALVEGSADIAFICQADGRISFSNPSFDAALHRPATRGGAMHLRDILPPELDVAAVLDQASGDGWVGEVVFHRPDRSRFPARLSLRPVLLERQRRPVLAATAVDLALIKEREALLRSALDDVAAARTALETLNRDLEAKVQERTHQLQRTVEDLDRLNQELRALDVMKTEFVTLVSHELRAPLTNIRAGLELMLPEGAGVPEPARSALRLIQEETARLGSFVEAILDLSALEAGRFPLRSAPLDFTAEARSAVERLRSVPGHERIRLLLGDDLPAVLADDRALASVLGHLLDNALKYAPAGEIELGARAEDDRVVAWVRDRGPGIPEADRERVFDMFHRLDSSDSREVYGHGLGLHLVRRLLEAMAGGIRAEAGAEGGARLVFWLPRAGPVEALENRPEPGHAVA
ncbi:MAG TPA: PAS domain-containing sensor histidine kinase [Anaerolineales bacterium]|nr:PAS domain-containing sensor histidine kinase [Anaerolineales bacterium]